MVEDNKTLEEFTNILINKYTALYARLETLHLTSLRGKELKERSIRLRGQAVKLMDRIDKNRLKLMQDEITRLKQELKDYED